MSKQVRLVLLGSASQLVSLPPLPTWQRLASYLKEKLSHAEKLKAPIEKRLEAVNAVPQAILRKTLIGEM